ncbi:hypothetical protein, conserved, partial [Eimeria tenella]
MAARNSSVPHLLQQMEDIDLDKRLMAASDLAEAMINNPQGIGAAWEGRAATAFLQQLEDNSIDVQANAVRCLRSLLSSFSPGCLNSIFLFLGNKVKDSSSSFRHIHSTCLRSLMLELPPSISSPVVSVLMTPLVEGIRSSNEFVRHDSLDILGDILSSKEAAAEDAAAVAAAATAAVAAADKELFLNLRQLLSTRPITARKAARCIGGLAATLPADELSALVCELMNCCCLAVGPLEALAEVTRHCSSSSSSSSGSSSSSSSDGGSRSFPALLPSICLFLYRAIAAILKAEESAA